MRLSLSARAQRVEADLLGLLVPPEHGEHVGVGRQHPGPGERVVVGGDPHGLRGDRGRVLHGLEGGQGHGARGQQGAPLRGRGVGGQGGELLGQQGGGALGVAAGAERLRGVDGQPAAVDQAVAGRAEAGEQAQGPLEVLRRLVGAADLGRLVAGLDAGLEGGLLVVGQLGVAGELGGGAAGAAVADRRGELGVQPDPLAGQEVVVDGLAEQRVAEGVVPVAGDQDVALDGRAQALLEGVVSGVGGDREQLVGDPAAGDAGGADDLARGLIEAVEPDEEHLGEVGGEGVVVGAGGGADQLLDEERVALGALDDHVDLVVGEHGAGAGTPAADQAGDQLADLRGVERLERHAVHVLEAGPLGDLGAQGVLAVQVVGAVRRHEGHRLAERAGEQEAHQVTGRLVGPVEVLDDEDEGLLLGGGLEEGVHGFEQRGFIDAGPTAGAAVGSLVDHPAAGREPVQGGVVGGHGGQELGGGGLDAAEDLGEWEVGQGAVAEVEAVAGDDLPAEVDGAVAQGGEESGLADAGVAGEKDGGTGLAGAGVPGRDDAEPESQILQLGISSHEWGGRHRRHTTHHVGCRGHQAPGFRGGGSRDTDHSGSADPGRAGALLLPAQPATGATGADGAPVLADPVHAVVDLRVEKQVVVHVGSLPLSRPFRVHGRDSAPEVGANIGQVPYLCPQVGSGVLPQTR